MEGALRCACGFTAPVRAGVPRFVATRGGAAAAPSDPFQRVQEKTQSRFGWQWQHFARMSSVFREDLERYLGSFRPGFFEGKVGLDVGCGFGRHAYYLSQQGAEIVGVDFSRAIDAASKNLRECENVHLVQADLYRLPFPPQTFDFIYSIGVLHHLPEPEAGFRALLPLLKPGGSIMIWVYSSARRGINSALEMVRRVTTKLPTHALSATSYAAGAIDYGGFVLPYKLLRSLPWVGSAVDRVAWERVKLYSRYPFDVICADWFDRLAAPARAYYDDVTLHRWLAEAGLSHPQVSPTGLYGWRAYGEAATRHYACS